MAKMVIAVPNPIMVSQAENAVRAMSVDAVILRENSQTVVEAVKREWERGAVVAVARGNHADLLLRETEIPVIEIVLSGQNLAMLFSQARSLSAKPHPHLGLVGFHNMFGDVGTLASVLELTVSTYFAQNSAEIGQAVEKAKTDGVDVIIGGEIAMEHAARLGMTHLFLHSTQDSIETAVSVAKRVMYAIELEKHKSAEFASLVNYSFDAILKLDDDGTVVMANYMAEKFFRREEGALRGQKIDSLLDLSAPDQPIKEAMREHRNVFATTVRAGQQALIANLAAINVDRQNMGFILSLQEFGKIEELEEQIRKERYNKGYLAATTFDDFTSVSPEMNEIKQTAMQYARYDLPVLIMGEVGVGKHALGECIHNASLRARNPFVTVDCGGLSGDMQQRRFMGESNGKGGMVIRGAFENAHMGTLMIEHIDKLDEYCQYQLLNVLKYGSLMRLDDQRLLPVDVRVLCTTDKNLYQCMKDGQFSEPLYCTLTQLEVRVPSLDERAEDLPTLLDMAIEKSATLYRKYIRLTPEARESIFCQHWGGNVLQLSLFCEKLVLLATEKVMTADMVRKYLPLSFRSVEEAGRKASRLPMVVQSPEEAALLQALEEHRGNRAETAEALGVSKTTLWRRMRKYGVEQSYR